MQNSADPLELVAWFEERLAEETDAMQSRYSSLLEKVRLHLLPASPTNCLNATPASHQTAAPAVHIDAPSEVGIVSEPVTPLKVMEPMKVKPGLGARKRTSALQATLQHGQSFEQERHQFHPSNLVRAPSFELFFAALIILNVVTMAVEAYYRGLDVGYKIGYPNHTKRAQDVWPWAQTFFHLSEVLFGVLFAIEVAIKIAGLRMDFVKNCWNWFDSFLVVVWVLDSIMTSLPVDSNLLRLVRLARLLRLIKLARTFQGFDSLVVMTTALQGSMSALLWVAVLLLFAQMLFAFFLGQTLTMVIEGGDLRQDLQLEVFKYFGTFPRAMLTMFELTLGNWIPVARLLSEHVNGGFMFFSIFHKVIFGFACIGVVNGVFMQETLKVAQSDDVIMMREAERKKKTHKVKMMDFFEFADISGDGLITHDEWVDVLESEKAKNWFAGQGLVVNSADLVWRLMDANGDGEMSPQELANGVSQLQGPAKTMDLVALQDDIKARMTRIENVLESLQVRQHRTVISGTRLSPRGGANVTKSAPISHRSKATEGDAFACPTKFRSEASSDTHQMSLPGELMH